MRIRRLLVGGAVGAAAVYLFDPVRGAGRRAKLQEGLGRAAGRLRTLSGGAAARLEPTPLREDDLSLLGRVETVLFAVPGYPRATVELEVVERRLVLTGEVPDARLARQIEAAAARVPGVAGVRSDLRVTRATPPASDAAPA